MKQFSPFCSQSPWQAVTTIFSGGPVAALPNYFLKSVKIFLPDSQSKRWRSDFRFDVPLQSKEKKLVTWSWHKTKHKSLCCWTKWALTFIHTHTQKKMNSKKVEKDTKRRRSISCNCLFFPTSGWNYCFPWLFALLDHLPVVSWRQCLGTKASSHAEMSSDEIIWSGKIQTDVKDKGLPCQPKRIIYWKNIKQPINPTKDQKIKKPGSPHGSDLQGRNFSSHLKTELNFSLK